MQTNKKGEKSVMSNRRAALRREQREREKISKNKSENGDLMRAQMVGFENGKIISACTVTDSLRTELDWNKDKIIAFTKSVAKQSSNGNPEIIEFAVQPWKNKLEQRIKEYSSELPKMSLNSILQGVEFQHRNMAYVGCCSLMFLNLFSNFNLCSNNKGSGTLDKIINQCVVHFYDLQQNPQKYEPEKCLERTRTLTGVSIQ